MKKLLFSILILTSCVEKKNDLEKHNLKGKVWKIYETTFEINSENLRIGNKINSRHSFYNEQSYLTETHVFYNERDSIIKWRYKYSYNENNILTEVIIFKNGKLDSKEVILVNGDKIIGAEIYDKDGVKTGSFEYKLSGNDIVRSEYKDKNGVSKYITYFELSNGFIDKKEVKDNLGNMEGVYTYTRNWNNDILEFSSSNFIRTDTIKFQYEYDEQNNWIKRLDFEKGNKVTKIIARNIFYFKDKAKVITEKDFIGKWFKFGDKDWLQIDSDKNYTIGYDFRSKFSGVWEINLEQNLLTLTEFDRNRQDNFKYEFEGNQLVLYIDGYEQIRYNKK